MQLDVYHIDAFCSGPFTGNPAAVVPLVRWLSDDLMQAIAAQFNLSETVFTVAEEDGIRIRWFTPEQEVKLCGHATLAAAWVLFQEQKVAADEVVFVSLSGQLSVRKSGDLLTLNFPTQTPTDCPMPAQLVSGLGAEPVACLAADDYVAVFESQARVEALQPDFAALQTLDRRGVIATAAGDQHDFVARFFAPRVGIPEDPVTGSAYTVLTPYWANRTGLRQFTARQLSRRGGELRCELLDERVLISGVARKFMQGHIFLE